MGRCRRDTTGIMIASNKTIIICNVQPYGWGERGWEKVLCFFKKSSVLSCLKKKKARSLSYYAIVNISSEAHFYANVFHEIKSITDALKRIAHDQHEQTSHIYFLIFQKDKFLFSELKKNYPTISLILPNVTAKVSTTNCAERH